jgi:zinc protease
VTDLVRFSILICAPLVACSAPSVMNSQTQDAREPARNAVFASAPQSPTSPSAARVFPYPVERHQLDNGLKVLFIPMPSGGLASYWSVVRTGSRDEVEEGVTGFAHFFEHMMFHGSKRFPREVYDKIVSGMGADANAFTTDDFTAYHLGIAAEDLPQVIEVEADRFQNLVYDEDEFKTEAGAVYGEYRKNRTAPFEVLFETVQDKAFDAHTYKHTTIGFERDIRAMPRQFAYSKSFFQRFYRPENVVLVVSGEFDAKKTLDLIRQHYGPWKRGYDSPAVPVEPEQRAERRIDVPFEGETLPLLSLNFKGERFLPGDRTMMAATLIGELCFGETSAIYKKLVLDEQRLDALFAGFGFNRDPGLWSVIARVKEPSDVPAVEGELWNAVQTLAAKPVNPALLDAARSRLKYSFLSGLSTPNDVNESIVQIVALTGDLTAVDEMYATLDRVTPQDVQAAAAKYLKRERCTVAVLHTAGAPLAKSAVGAEPPVLMPVPNDPNVAFKIWFKVGSQDDPPGKEGLAELVGAMIGEGGTKRRSYDQILEALFPLAASYSASVDKEMTVVSGTVHRDKLAEFYALFSDALLAPGFRAEDFERLRDNAINEIEKSLRFSSDEELGKATLISRVFADTRYEHLTLGTVAALRSIQLEDVQTFHAAHYTRDNLVVGLAGAYPPSLPPQLEADLARLPAGKPAPVDAPAPAPITGRHVTIVEKAGPSAAISFGHPIDVKRGSREYYALWIANSWLGEHRNSNSHLYQVIREARGMNYGDYSYIEAYPRGGRLTKPPTGVGRRGQMFEVWIRPVPNSLAMSLAKTDEERAALAKQADDHIPTLFALRAALREVEHLAANGLTREEFEATRKFLSKYSLHFAETTAERLGYAIDDRYFEVRAGHLALFRKMMQEITLEEVNAAVKKHLRPNDLEIAIVAAHAEELKRKILENAPSAMGYGDVKKPAEILAEDKEIERHPLRVQDVTIVPVEAMFAGAGS